MINLTRTFYPIGQGAFYTEILESKFIAVYDCGGSGKQIIEDEIKATFAKGQKIDIVFISHLHNDHINGLELLFNYCDVKKVILPLLSDAMKIWYVVENAIYNRSEDLIFINDLILTPEKALENKVIFVEPDEERNQDSETVDISNLPQQIKSGTILNTNHDWIYVPVNFYYDIYANDLKVELAKIGVNLSNIVSKLQTHKKDIIDIYKKVLSGTKNFNANSMTVYSGSKDNKNLSMITKQNSKFVISKKVGCLYLGDFEAKEQDKFDNLKKVYKKYWNHLSTIQIPHHGSSHNFHKNLAWNGSISVVSTSFRYNHPSAEVVKTIAKQNSFFALVTKSQKTKVVQFINYSKVKILACISDEFRKILINKYPEYFI